LGAAASPTALARDCLPRRFAGAVHGMHVEREPLGAMSRAIDLPHAAPRDPGRPCGITPAEIRARYAIPADQHAAGETIALMALGGLPDRRDLEDSWAAWGVPAPELHARQVGGGTISQHPLHILETTMSLAWLGAMAPGARLVVYFIDPERCPDPWVTFLQAVIADDDLRPTVATTSWSTPEYQYYRTHGRETFASLLDQAAALGITVLAASGDWGALAGFPRMLADGRRACVAAWPHAVFPAVEARVLAVGGTMPCADDPAQEEAWNVRVSPEIRRHLGLGRLASSGGFSELVPIPAWQAPLLRPTYARTDGPAVIPDGRGYPDVVLLAGGGADIPDSGFGLVLGGRWCDDGGGTSLTAPIWATIVAGLNHARREQGLPRLGDCTGKLHDLAARGTGFTPIARGNIDLVVPALDSGELTPHRVAGYVPTPHWNPATGLGTPRVDELRRALTEPVHEASQAHA
ncbi:MAG TPA: S53 family peptidase, partial [Nannocystis sp.]